MLILGTVALIFRGVKFANTTQMQLRSLLLRQSHQLRPATY